MAAFFPINAPLVNYFFYNYTLTDPGPNIPIAGGFVFFRDDADHDIDKPTYSDVSDPANPVINTNPLELNDAGATPLYYAEPGLYYIVVTGPDGDLDNPIWTFEHVNFEGGAGTSGENVVNYISNGQFLLHNDLPETADFEAGEVREAITDIAYGGWTFERPGDSTSKDFITFERYDEWSDNPPGNPRFALRVRCTVPDSGDAFKDIRLTYPNVNQFASDTQQYTFSFSGKDADAGDIPIQLYLIKNFGSGGDPETETLLTTFNLTPDESRFYFSFSFGDNAGKVIGVNNDDYVQLALRLPTSEESDILVTSFDQESGILISPTYPETTQRQDIESGLGGAFPIPNPNGSDLFLMPKLVKNGWIYDDSCIGDAVCESQVSVYVDSLHPTTNRLLANGEKYERAAYSPLGIPFSRLFDKYWDNTLKVPVYGTGLDFLTAYLSALSPTTQIRIPCNSPGSATNAADGTPATGFTFATIVTGSTIGLKAGRTGTDTLLAIDELTGTRTAPTAGTSGFTVTDLVNNGSLTHTFEITTIAATTLAGKYFTFTENVTNFYMWFRVDGAGADPTPGGTGIRVDLKSTYGADEVCSVVLEAITGRQITTVVTVAGSVVPAGSYFLLNTPTPESFYVWYKVNEVGTDPAPGGKIPILVEILNTDVAADVAFKTQIAINQKYFAVPDPRGLFFRVWAQGISSDLDRDTRFSTTITTYYGDKIGTLQLYGVENHIHYSGLSTVEPPGGAYGGGTLYENYSTNPPTSAYGGNETRSSNMYVNCAILY